MTSRPPPKNRAAKTNVPQEVYDAAKAKAEERGSTISKILRSFLILFANNETPPGWPPELPEEDKRAQKRSRKKKSASTEEPPTPPPTDPPPQD